MTLAPVVNAGRRFVESPDYKRARRDGVFQSGYPVEATIPSGIEVLNARELRAALGLRAYTDLSDFSIEGVPFVGELPSSSHLPQAVETIPVDNLQVELDTESSESQLAGAVEDGQPLPEASFNFGTTPVMQKLPRFGVSVPVTLGMLDESGQVESLINRRLQLGFGLGLENDMINGNNWGFGGPAGNVPGGLLANYGTGPVAKGVGYRAIAIRNGVAEVQDAGWYLRPHQVVINPLTLAAVFEEEDGSQRPLNVMEEFAGQVDSWIVTNKMPVGEALVGDFFAAIALFVKGGLTVEVSRNHLDFLKRSMCELKLENRSFAWLRQPTAVALVTGLS